MSNDLVVRLEELYSNPSPRVPIVLCLDVSGSMEGDKIHELNRGVNEFFQALKADEVAASSASVAIVVFSNTGQMLQNFTTIESLSSWPEIEITRGATAIGNGVNLSLDMLAEQKGLYKQTGVDYYQPWLVIMTDGQPYGEEKSEYTRAADRTRQLESEGKLVVFPIGIGADADMNVLQLFSLRTPLRLKGLRFKEFFQWLSQSVVRVSQSRPGEKVKLDIKGIDSWGEI